MVSNLVNNLKVAEGQAHVAIMRQIV
jgi:hypothetical protein